MKFANPALLRVFSALAVVAIFTAGVHEMRKGGGAAADFPCTTNSSQEIAIAIGEGATGTEIGRASCRGRV